MGLLLENTLMEPRQIHTFAGLVDLVGGGCVSPVLIGCACHISKHDTYEVSCFGPHPTAPQPQTDLSQVGLTPPCLTPAPQPQPDLLPNIVSKFGKTKQLKLRNSKFRSNSQSISPSSGPVDSIWAFRSRHPSNVVDMGTHIIDIGGQFKESLFV